MSNYRISRHKYSLDTAQKALPVAVFGNYVQVVDASSLTAEIGVEMAGDNLKTDGALGLRKDDFIRVPDPFSRAFLTWTAQAGEWVEIVFITQDPAPEEFEYVRQQRGVIDSIASTVSITDIATSLVMSTVTATAGAALGIPANPNVKQRGVYNSHATHTLFYSPQPTMVDSMPILPGVFKTIPFTGNIYFKTTGANVTVNVEEFV